MDYVASGLGGAIAAIPGSSIMSAMAAGAAGNLVTDGLNGNISSVTDVVVSAGSGALANGFADLCNTGFAQVKANKISSMSRPVQKNYLTDKVFKNSRSYANANLATFRADPRLVVKQSFTGFRSGIYSTTISTISLTTFGVFNR